jgi:hypothetical protein
MAEFLVVASLYPPNNDGCGKLNPYYQARRHKIWNSIRAAAYAANYATLPKERRTEPLFVIAAIASFALAVRLAIWSILQMSKLKSSQVN